ncbi:MAG TPA: cytochrome-c oxidase, cbb3-type subunit III [Methylophilaceae bacterium]|nr:cytochrome-c oxidase, cbb3-type subunit III [Methylophilaceae bacterium]
MSDFTNEFWPIFITLLTLLGIFGCAWLLWKTGKIKVPAGNDGTSGHVWDGDIREMNNPLPRWWVWLFVITIVFAIIYLIAYPGLGRNAGRLGWTEVGQYDHEVAEANKKLEPMYARFAAMSIPDTAVDPKAKAIGERLFMNNCSQCHGSDARGSRGFPNLTDADWIHGGSPEKIQETITIGRIGMMPPMAAAVGNEEDVKNVANYVLSLSGSPHDAARAALGKEKFTTICAACHGVDGKGNQAIGAPNLSDNIWLHGAGEAAIITRINQGKTNQMPAQGEKLTPAQIHLLAAYVWGLSNKPGAVSAKAEEEAEEAKPHEEEGKPHGKS